MSNLILDCPLCQSRFPFQNANGIPEFISCPRCGKEAHSNDFSAMMFCPSCRSKLAVPLEMLDGSMIDCPHCEHSFLPETDSLMEEEASAGDFEEDTGSSSEKRIFEDGAFFDKYKIIKMLGKGGMAEVYLAEHLLLKQFYALKLMRPSLYDSNPRFIKRFIREAKLTHKIHHPNIVSVHDVGSDQKTGFLFIAMEYLDGKSLLDTVKERTLTERELLDVALNMSSALMALEEEKVVHRDIKPSNIMFCKDGALKLMDLGVAKAETGSMEGEITLTVEQTSIGTPSYASPEQCECAHNVDIRSDIYCLGATLYHAASSHVPFGGGTPFEIMLKVLREEPAPLGKYRKDLSSSFLHLVGDMMKKDPGKRPQTAAALQKRIQDCILFLENPEEFKALSALPSFQYREDNAITENTPEKEINPFPSAKNSVLPSDIANLPPPPTMEEELFDHLHKEDLTAEKESLSKIEAQSAAQKNKQKKQVRLVGKGEKFTGIITTFTGKMQKVENYVLPYLKSTIILKKNMQHSSMKKIAVGGIIAGVILILLLLFLSIFSRENDENGEFSMEQIPMQEISGTLSHESAPDENIKNTAQKTSAKESGNKEENLEVESVRSW